MRKVLLLASVICLITVACAQSCGENEVFKECGTCDGTCLSPTPQCPPVCKRGCFCKPTFVRDSEGKCIDIKACPLNCGKNEIFNSCPEYCKLDDDCEYLLNNRTVECFAPHDNFPCQPRCECKPGFVRIKNECVSPDRCCSDPNEVAVDCPSSCQETCSSVPSADCKLSPCFIKGCLCKPGYVKNDNGVCIPRENCPIRENQEITTPRTIIAPTEPPVRNAAPANAAPIQICGLNKIYSTCIPAYEPTCLSGVRIEAEICRPGCICLPGFFRNGDECITSEQCRNARSA